MAEGVRVAGSDGPGDGARWRVFVSHTSELRDFPPGKSYVAAVERAVSAAGHVIVDMADFPAASQPPAQVCADRVRGCDVYLGVLGTRYGSPVRDRPEVSYTELEFDTATAAGLDRLVFLLDTGAADVGIPLSALIDHEYGARQDAFRRRVRDSGLVTASFANPDMLGQLVERSLRELAETRRCTGGAGQIINVSGASGQPVPPELLPRDIPGFTGRSNELRQLKGLAGGGSVVVTAIDGTAGVGKTALAIHAAHMLREVFPDGRLYADLRGYTEGQEAADPGDVLVVFLRHLGIAADELPASLEEQSGLFRQLLSSRRMLVILDNVATEAQVRPLLPGTGSSMVVITSRGVLAGLGVDARIHLDLRASEETTELLTRLVGEQRAAAEPDAVRRVGDLCGRLPLAIWIAGQLLAAHSVWPISHLAELVTDEQERLDTLVSGDREVRSAFMVSYRQLPSQDRRLFRLLGLYPGPDFSGVAAASMADLEPVTAGQVLDRFELAHLVTSDAAGRFRLHDLLRLFAREICFTEDNEVVRAKALARLIDHFEQLAGFLDAYLNPWRRAEPAKAAPLAGASPLTHRQVLAVFETERESMLAVLALAADQQRHEAVCRIAEDMVPALWLLWRLGELMGTSRAALDAAKAAGNRDAEARALTELGKVYVHQRQFDQAFTFHREALEIYRETGNRNGETHVLVNLGYAYQRLEQFDQAIACHQEALEISRNCGDRRTESHTLNNLGLDYIGLRKFDQAITFLQQSREIDRETCNRESEGHTLGSLGIAYHQLRQFDQALTCHQEALEIHRDYGDKWSQGFALIDLGSAYRELRQFDQALTCYQEALEIYRDCGDRWAEGAALIDLSSAYRELRQFDQALTCYQEALEIYREAGYKDGEARALAHLGFIHHLDLRQFGQARKYFGEAVEAYRQGGDNDTIVSLEEQLAHSQAETGRPWWRRNWLRGQTKS